MTAKLVLKSVKDFNLNSHVACTENNLKFTPTVHLSV